MASVSTGRRSAPLNRSDMDEISCVKKRERPSTRWDEGPVGHAAGMAGTPWRVPRVSRGASCRDGLALTGRLRVEDAHVDLAPAPVVDEPLQHFAEHVEVHLVVPIDQFDRFTVLTVQF